MTMTPSDPPPARLSLTERRRRILETAIQVYAQHGFHQTGMRQLCTALGMSAGALYRYFPGKEAIIAGLVEMDRETIQSHLRSLPQEAGFIAAMAHMTDMVMSDLAANAGLLAIWSEISAEATRSPAVAALLAGHYQFIENLLSSMVKAAMKKGELRQGLDPLATARFLMAAHDGMMTRRAIDPSYPLNKAAHDSLTIFAHAVGAAPPVKSTAKKPRRKTP